MRRVLCLSLLLSAPAFVAGKADLAEKMLYDFEEPAEIKAWSNLELPDARDKEPPVKLECVAENATAGKRCLKLTFAGGRWPTVTTTQVLDNWLPPYQTLKADVTVIRPCVVGFTVHQEKSLRGSGWEALISRWTKTAFLHAGTNHIVAVLPQPNDYAIAAKWGKVIRFEIFMYQPHDGESIFVDNIRLSTDKVAPPQVKQFILAGTDTILSGKSSADAVIALGKMSKEKWTAPTPNSVEQVETDFKKHFGALKEKHPKVMLAVLRDGETGYDSTQPDKVFAGWKDAYWNSHGPDTNYVDRGDNRGKSASHEIFMRHRSPLMRVDLGTIPAGSNILAARLLVVRANEKYLDDHNPEKKPTMWVVEPCNRPWEEYEVNAFQYAKDKFWKEIGGMSWGEDPDFLPTFLAHGPGTVKALTLDFAEAVRFWTDGKHPNHGFMLHGDSHDYMTAHSREAKEVKNRPAVLVVYEPK